MPGGRLNIRIVFWVSLTLLGYAWAGYPLLLWILGRGRRWPAPEEPARLPAVSLLIPAHNEAEVLPAKLDNCRDLDYPADRLEIVVISDASTDATDRFAEERGGANVRLFRLPDRLGKVEGLNRAVPGVRGEILVVSDANTMLRRDAIRNLVRHFGDRSVGLVSGELRLVNPGATLAGAKESLYWRYECRVRRFESRLGRIMGATGPLYACRTGLFRPVPPNMFDDLVIPVRILLAGYSTRYDPDAVGWEEAAGDVRSDLHRRLRNASRGARSTRLLLGEAFRLGAPGVSLQLFSHKLLRWVTFPLLVGIFAGSAAFGAPPARVFLLLQALFYAAAITGGILDRVRRSSNPFLAPYYFTAAQAASFVGLLVGLTTRGNPYWSPRGA
ncbi:MAG: glycosyltransferase family 2 protein [Acidobacteria bacterium]|nr:glycosyltransferase family 2 protein [Acidobacteriota bacterium]